MRKILAMLVLISLISVGIVVGQPWGQGMYWTPGYSGVYNRPPGDYYYYGFAPGYDRATAIGYYSLMSRYWVYHDVASGNNYGGFSMMNPFEKAYYL